MAGDVLKASNISIAFGGKRKVERHTKFPSHNAVPLVQTEGKISMASNPLGIVRIHDLQVVKATSRRAERLSKPSLK